MNHFAGPSSFAQYNGFPQGDPFTYGPSNSLPYGPLPYGNPLAHNKYPFAHNNGLTPYMADPNPYTENTVYSEWPGPPFHGFKHFQAMGHRPRIARRIAREVYGIDPDSWSRRARSFVL